MINLKADAQFLKIPLISLKIYGPQELKRRKKNIFHIASPNAYFLAPQL